MEPTADALVQPTRLDVAEVLRTVIDPELGVNIIDLGLVYDIRAEGGRVEIDLTMTTPACPLSSYITQQIEHALRLLPNVGETRVELVWSPPWSPAMMAPEVRPGSRPTGDRPTGDRPTGDRPTGGRQPFRFFR